MRYGSLETIVTKLEAAQQEKTQALMATARQKAQNVYQEVLAEGKERLKKRQERFFKQLQTEKTQALTRLKMQQQLTINRYKQEWIEQELNACLEEMKQMSTATFNEWLQHYLTKQVQVPTIRVSPERFDSVVASFPGYLVESDATIVSGFILSYETFDVNQELAQVVRFKKQELLRKMSLYLFEDDSV